MNKEKEHLPIYGVGPYYGLGIILLSVIGILLSIMGPLSYGSVTHTFFVILFIILGLFFIVIGFIIWKMAALGKKNIDSYIKSNMLCTSGVYSIVRNPCYSGIMLMCTGAILITHNLWLFILPVVYWLAMTILMKCTEEKWLTDLYGHDYIYYCQKVNRCIPWFPRK